MKRFLLPVAALALGWGANAQNPNDSMQLYHLQQIEVVATRAAERTPVAHTDITREQIAANNYGLDIPFVLMMTPSLVATNETGTGVGATSMRLRGTDATRLNVTANGVPLNNPDSHAMYWYDTPDLISSVGTVQVQRGAGTSTNGTGAFGGAINLTTDALSPTFGGDASLSYGSYNTNKQAMHINSGLLSEHWVVDARLTHIGSAGYIDRGTTDLRSYMLQGAYYNANTMIKLLSFGGKARTYLTYDGVSKQDMADYGRRYHTSGQYVTSDGPAVLNDGTHVGYYDDQTDNYLQINNQLHLNHRFDARWQMNLTGFYTYGYGFYRQYKDDSKLIENGFSPADAFDPGGEDIEVDVIRKKLMRNHFGGLNASAHYTGQALDVAFGGSWSIYACPHWGELPWADGAPQGFSKDMRWYENDVDKRDANLFARANWRLGGTVLLFADLQYRYVHYKAWGVNDNYDEAIDAMQRIDVDQTYHFFNPKAGITYTPAKGHTLYASFSIANKEPTRSDFTDRFREVFPTSERMYDYEAGYRFESRTVSAAINFYYMDYKDQLVKTGQINDSYDALNINVARSYRRGIELSASVRPTVWFTFGANATFSQNRIRDYVNKVVDYALWDDATNFYGYTQTPMGTTTISYSPSVVAATLLDFHYKGFEAVLHTQYVGEQYFTNYRNPDMKLDAYCVSNLNLGYTFRTEEMRSVRFGLSIYNLFNARYSSNGFGYSEAYEGKQSDYAFYFPQAPTNVLANVTVKF